MKRGKKMILLLVVLAVLVGGYFGVQQMNKPETVAETTGSFALTEKTAEEMTGLRWTAGETSWAFRMEDGAWVTEEEPAWPVNQGVLQDLAEQLIALQATRKLENITSEADYGLETPAITVTAAWSDGTETAYRMGDATPFADGYYLKISGGDGVIYTIASSLSDLFSKTRKDMVALEALPTVEDAVRLTVGTRLDAVKLDESLTVDPEQRWYDAETKEPLEGSAVESLISTASGLAWNDLVIASADADTLASWQLDDASATAVSLTGSNGETATVLFGILDESSNYYARLPGSAMVYTVSGSDVGSLMTASKASLRISAVLPLPYDHLASATFTTERGAWTLEKESAQPTAETAESPDGTAAEETGASTEPAETVDKTASAENGEEARQQLWEKVTALRATDFPESAANGARILTIHALSSDGMETEAVITEYSADAYQAIVDGGASMLISADETDALIRAVRTME